MRRARIITAAATTTVVSILATSALATDWQSYNGAGGPYNYNDGGNWVGGTPPNGGTAPTANLTTTPITNANLAVNLDVAVSLYQLTLGDQATRSTPISATAPPIRSASAC